MEVIWLTVSYAQFVNERGKFKNRKQNNKSTVYDLIISIEGKYLLRSYVAAINLALSEQYQKPHNLV